MQTVSRQYVGSTYKNLSYWSDTTFFVWLNEITFIITYITEALAS